MHRRRSWLPLPSSDLSLLLCPSCLILQSCHMGIRVETWMKWTDEDKMFRARHVILNSKFSEDFSCLDDGFPQKLMQLCTLQRNQIQQSTSSRQKKGFLSFIVTVFHVLGSIISQQDKHMWVQYSKRVFLMVLCWKVVVFPI